MELSPTKKTRRRAEEFTSASNHTETPESLSPSLEPTSPDLKSEVPPSQVAKKLGVSMSAMFWRAKSSCELQRFKRVPAQHMSERSRTQSRM